MVNRAQPNPTGSQYAVLSGASCPSTTSCFAVGFAQLSSGGETLVEHWNGHNWSIRPRPTPTGTNNSSLSRVSCPSTANCFAVGSYTVGAVTNSLAAHWNGHTWSITPSPNPARATSTVLSGLSCPTTTQCFAVGFFSLDVPGGSVDKTLVEHWDGNIWSIMISPDPAFDFNLLALNAVSCHRAASCFAVGDFGGYPSHLVYSTTTLIERYR